MPNPENGCEDLKQIFINQVFNIKRGKRARWNMVAALSGAHTIGKANVENSGYSGMWGDSKNQQIFNNDYFRNIYAHGWGPDLAVNGNSDKNQWKLIDKSSQEDIDEQMMLNSDMCLFYQSNTKHAVCMSTE